MRASARWGTVLGASLAAGAVIFLGLVAAAPALHLLVDGPCDGWTSYPAGRHPPAAPATREITVDLRDNETFTLVHPSGRWLSHIEVEGARYGLLGGSGHIVAPGYMTTVGGSYCARDDRIETYLAEGNGTLVARYWELP